MKKDNQIKLYNDEATYKFYQDKEADLQKVVSKIEKIVDSSIGENLIDDYIALLENPIPFITDLYFNTWGCKVAPPNANRITVFESNTRLKVTRINDLKAKYDTLYKELDKHAPRVNKSGLNSNLKESSFDKFLDKSKEAEYKTLTNFLDAASKLQEFRGGGVFNLVRYHPELRFKGTDVIINLTYFAA
jgi:hypothetical protein